ncbi:variable surface protein [Plasmodium gonderi]|uniref:Variable surface protein n=1 Tax=Plasmodium gonderi TaxID=77519 RepID=A0A1Y1JR74_PLAGO|nr:variable surface protein [Plasmodium gonderi]GAW83995.1 variable surface protein [Plasmodium gonderi]
MAYEGFNTDNLPSNKFKKELLEKANLDKLKSLISAATIDNSDVYEWIDSFNSDVNYYLDLVSATIYLSNLVNSDKKNSTDIIEDYWQPQLNKYGYKCDRNRDSYSTIKRCILKQVRAFLDDKYYLKKILIQNLQKKNPYDEYLKDKWNKILQRTKSTFENRSIRITISGINKSIKYDELPLKYNFLKANFSNTEKNNNLEILIEDLMDKHRQNSSASTSGTHDMHRTQSTHDENIREEDLRYTPNAFPYKFFLNICYIIVIAIIIIILLYKVI